jgi:putative flippase GtrA
MSSVLATIVDFGVMVTVVEALHVSAVKATMAGAACGAFTNFMMARHFTYRVGGTAAHTQLLRFLLVAATSLALNATGEHLLHNVLHLQYVVARVIVAIVVSNAWNYPMQRFFVFSERKKRGG